jgi:hypothetical protein
VVAGPVANVTELYRREKCSVRWLNMTIPLALLAPNLVKAVAEGRLPRGIGVERLRDLPAEWSRQFEAHLIQNSAVQPEIRITLAGIAIAAASTPGIQARAWLPRTELLDTETRLQKSPLKHATACRDRNPKTGWPKVSAETPSLASYRKGVVREG